MSGVFRERAWRLTLLGSAVRVDERQFARLHRLLAEVGQSLDATVLPEMYVQADPSLNAQTIGMDRPVIVLSSGLVHHLDDDELRFVIGHELGHAVSGHAVYRTLRQERRDVELVEGATAGELHVGAQRGGGVLAGQQAGAVGRQLGLARPLQQADGDHPDADGPAGDRVEQAAEAQQPHQ